MKKTLLALTLALAAAAALCTTAWAMELFITLPDGSRLVLEVESGDSIRNVKAKIEEKTGWLIAEQKLTGSGSELSNGRTLVDYNIQKEGVLTLEILPTITLTKEYLAANSDRLGHGLYRLEGDLETTQTILVKDKSEAALDLNGHILKYTGTSSGSVVRIEDSDSGLTLLDSAPAAAHSPFTSPVTGETYTVAGGVITGGTGDTQASGDLHGGGVYIHSGSLYMLGGTVTGCNVYRGAAGCGYGGGVYVAGGSFEMSGGAITHCRANDGGGVYVGGGGTFAMSGRALIENCRAGSPDDSDGVHNGGGFYMTGGRIVTAAERPAVKLANCTSMTGGTVEGKVERGEEIEVIYTVTFMDGSSRCALQYFAEGSGTIRLQAVKPTLGRSGYEVTWHKADGTPWDFSTDLETELGMLDVKELTLYAKWTATGGHGYYGPAAPVEAPKTADAGIAVYAVTALLSLTGVAWTGRRKS